MLLKSCATTLLVAFYKFVSPLTNTSITSKNSLIVRFIILSYKTHNTYPFSATTRSILPGIISLSILSIPLRKVMVEEGQPLHAP